MKKVLVTGACGFIGRKVVDQLLGQYEVIATDHPDANFSVIPNRVNKIGADLTDKKSLEILAQEAPILVNCAGIINGNVDPKLLKSVNVLAIKRLTKYGKGNLKKIVHLSSIGVYGIPEQIPATELCLKKPRNAYEESKLQGEIALRYGSRDSGIEYSILRPAYVYGIGGPQDVSLPYILLRGNHSLFKGCKLHLVHVEDVARATKFLVDHGQDKQGYNICDDDPLYLIEFMRELAEPLGIEIKEMTPNWLWKGLTKIGKKVISERMIEKKEKKLIQKWIEFQEYHGLKEGLNPKLSKSFFDYLLHHQEYSNKKIKALGFELKHPSSRGKMHEIVNHYRERGCLPQL